MNQKSFNTYAGTIFLIVALGHLWRVLNQIPVNFGRTELPLWLSWVALVVAGIMAYQGLRKRRN